MLFAIMMLLTLNGMCQTKPADYVSLKVSDVKLIIESNERGKKAQAMVPLF